MGKGKKNTKQLSPEEQQARAAKRRMDNGGDEFKGAPRKRGPKVKGAGSQRVGRGAVTVAGVLIKEWQRTPKQILHEWTQKNKRSRPFYQKRPAKPSSKHRVSAYLPDPNPSHKERSLRFTPDQSFNTVLAAEHSAALLALQGIDASIPHEKKLPEPFRQMWCDLVGRSGKIEVKLTVKEQKKLKKAAKLAEARAAKLAKLSGDTVTTAANEHGVHSETKSNTSGKNSSSSSVPAAPSSSKSSKSFKSPPLSAAIQKPKATQQKAQRGAPKQPISLTSTQRYQSVHERNQVRLQQNAKRSAVRRERENRQSKNASVVMSDANRKYIKEILRDMSEGRDDVQEERDPEEEQVLVEQLVDMGFGSDQASLALQMRSTVEDALNWLLVNIPEEDLPTSFDPRKTNAISIGKLHSQDKNKPSGGSGNEVSNSDSNTNSINALEPSNTIERDLYESGFSIEKIRQALKKTKNNQWEALLLMYGKASGRVLTKPSVNNPEVEEEDEDSDEDSDEYGEEPLEDEVLVLESMYPDSIIIGPNPRKKERGNGMEISMDVGPSVVSLGQDGIPVTVEMWLPMGSKYPSRCSSRPGTLVTCVVLIRHPSLTSIEREQITNEIAKEVYEARKEGGGVISIVLQYLQDTMLNTIATVKAEERKKLHSGHSSTSQNTSTLKMKMKMKSNPKIKNGSSTENETKTKSKTKEKTKVGGVLEKVARTQHNSKNKKSRHRYGHVTILTNHRERTEMSSSLKKFHEDKDAKLRKDEDFKDIQNVRKGLPSAKEEKNIVTSCYNNRVVLISGETGCGKTTQVPQFILNDAMKNGRGGDVNIICTQPRRIAAIGVAERVAKEQGTTLGDVVGYQIRLDKKMSKRTRLLFCTTGILLRRMQGDMDMNGVTHIVVDEVHERNVDTDFLLAVLRSLVRRKNSRVKVVLMSATMDARLFERYFHQGMEKEWPRAPPIISIPGRTFPVTEVYLEDVLERTKYIPHARSGWRSVSIDTAKGGERSQDGSKGATGAKGAKGAKDSNGKETKEEDGPQRESTSIGGVHPYHLGQGSDMNNISNLTYEALQKLNHDSKGPRRRGGGGGGSADYNLVASAVALADREGMRDRDDGAILVFMSGTMEINKTIDAIRRLYDSKSQKMFLKKLEISVFLIQTSFIDCNSCYNIVTIQFFCSSFLLSFLKPYLSNQFK